MTRPSTAARRYAEAAFECAERDGSIEEWGADLTVVAALIGEEHVMRVVDDPSRPFAERQSTVDRLLGKRVHPPARNLVRILSERGRLELVPQIAAEYRRLLKKHKGIVTATVTSAAPLTDDETKAIERRLREMTGAEVEIEPVIDESLIGGLTVRVGDQLYDSSVRGRLERLRNELVAGVRVGRGA
jgi:F-type H+-transporting ATPase subunit delta